LRLCVGKEEGGEAEKVFMRSAVGRAGKVSARLAAGTTDNSATDSDTANSATTSDDTGAVVGAADSGAMARFGATDSVFMADASIDAGALDFSSCIASAGSGRHGAFVAASGFGLWHIGKEQTKSQEGENKYFEKMFHDVYSLLWFGIRA